MRITEITDGIIDEAVNPENIDLSSFKVKSELNPKIFDSNQKMHPELKSRLIMIADDFFDIRLHECSSESLCSRMNLGINWFQF